MNRFLISLLVALIPLSSFALPARVLIIRHGEKPAVGNELTPQGFERAHKLVHFFQTDSVVNRFGAIAGIYAMKPKDATGSVRAIQTVTPTAQALNLTLNSQYKKDEISNLVNDIKNNRIFDGRTVLICWEHKVIPTIAQALGLSAGPQNWDGGEVYDRMWVLTYAPNGTVSFQDLPENVLPGDSSQ
jgi:hypothetical protein